MHAEASTSTTDPYEQCFQMLLKEKQPSDPRNLAMMNLQRNIFSMKQEWVLAEILLKLPVKHITSSVRP